MTERYFGDVIGSYQNGIQLDVRVKMAVDFIKAPICEVFAKFPNHTPEHVAIYALDVACALLAEAGKRGLTAPMPDTDELSGPMRKHIRRQVRAQVVGQIAGQAFAAEESPKVAVAGAGSVSPIRPS